MCYATLDDLVDRFTLELVQALAGAADGEPDFDMIEATLRDASEIIDSYVAGRYQVPLLPVPAPVRRWCCDITLYFLYKFEMPEYVRKNYEDALSSLKAVAKGLIQLQAAGIGAETSLEQQVVVEGARRVFSEQAFRGY